MACVRWVRVCWVLKTPADAVITTRHSFRCRGRGCRGREWADHNMTFTQHQQHHASWIRSLNIGRILHHEYIRTMNTFIQHQEHHESWIHTLIRTMNTFTQHQEHHESWIHTLIRTINTFTQHQEHHACIRTMHGYAHSTLAASCIMNTPWTRLLTNRALRTMNTLTKHQLNTTHHAYAH